LRTNALLALGIGLSFTLALGVGFWATRDERRQIEPAWLALSPQECTTECQTRQTDCILDCDGHIPCEIKCTEVGKVCVEHCRRPARDAGVAPPRRPHRPDAGRAR